MREQGKKKNQNNTDTGNGINETRRNERHVRIPRVAECRRTSCQTKHKRKCPQSFVLVKEKDVLLMQRRKVTGVSSQIHLLYPALELSEIFLGTNSTRFHSSENVETANWMRYFCFCLKGVAKFSKTTPLNSTVLKMRWVQRNVTQTWSQSLNEYATFQMKRIIYLFLPSGTGRNYRTAEKSFSMFWKKILISPPALHDFAVWLFLSQWQENVAYRRD